MNRLLVSFYVSRINTKRIKTIGQMLMLPKVSEYAFIFYKSEPLRPKGVLSSLMYRAVKGCHGEKSFNIR